MNGLDILANSMLTQLAVAALIGAGVSGLGLVVYAQVLKAAQRRRGQRFQQVVAGAAAVTPQTVNAAALRAKLDDLRGVFEAGIDTFRAADKDLYALPWYLLVGEPGGGKTEAIRHSAIGFPPGLQDELQGAGGTINMNWWFTNFAVILDTAGRLIFEDLEPGTAAEWREFLRLLRVSRPECPINGMILAIPADALIADEPAVMERKAQKIAQQLDMIQKALGVRFPVFVTITKSDLISGFREFFADLDSPEEAYQMLGWSNPDPLDSPFEPARVGDHLDVVRDRLLQRRWRLLNQPPAAVGEPTRKLDEVDGLFAFPDSLRALAPRLKRYLELIFTPGVWSAKPPFLRGIYFTSAMQKGSELDMDAAQVLGVAVQTLTDFLVDRAQLVDRDKSLFLRDVFTEKVFVERGLVTAERSAAAAKRRRSVVVLVAASLAAVLLIGLTWVSAQQLQSDVSEQQAFWTRLSETVRQELPGIVQAGDSVGYRSAIEPESADGQRLELDQLLRDSLAMARQEVNVPVVFQPVAGFSGSLLAAQRWRAHRALLMSTLLSPLVRQSRIELLTRERWSREATAALAELMRIEHEAANTAMTARVVDLSVLGNFLLASRPAELKAFQADLVLLQEIVDRSFDDAAYDDPLVREALGVGGRSAQSTLIQGLERFAEFARGENTGGNLRTQFGELLLTLRQADHIEKRLLEAASGPMPTTAQAWDQKAQKLLQESAALAARVDVLRQIEDRLQLDPEADWSERLIADAVGEPLQALARFAELSKLPATQTQPEASVFAQIRNRLAELRSQIEASVAEKIRADFAELTPLMRSHLPRPSGAEKSPVEYRVQAYQAAAEALKSASSQPGSGQGHARLAEAVGVLENPMLKGGRGREALAAVTWMGELAALRQRTLELQEVLANLPADKSALAKQIAQRARAAREPGIRWRPIPLTAAYADGTRIHGPLPEYEPAAAAAELGRLDELARSGDQLRASNMSTLELDQKSLARLATIPAVRQAYLADYLNYWVETVAAGAKVKAPTTWPEFHRELTGGNLRSDRINGALVELDQRRRQAIVELQLERQAQAALAAIELQQAEMTDALNPRAADTLDAFAELPADPQQALDMLGRMDVTTFQRRHLAAYALRVPYWDALIEQALAALARSGEGKWAQMVEPLLALKGFPLLPTGDDLSAAQLTQAGELVEKLAPLLVPREPSGDDRTLGSGARPSRFAQITQLLDEALGTAQLARYKTWLGRLRYITSAVPETQFTIVIVPPRLQGGTDVKGKFIEIYSNGLRLSAREPLDQPKVLAATVPASGADLEVRFFAALTGDAFATARLASRYAALRLLLDPATAEPLAQDRDPATSGVYRVTLTLDRPAARFTTVVLGLKPSRAIDRKAWPTPEQWPAGGGR